MGLRDVTAVSWRKMDVRSEKIPWHRQHSDTDSSADGQLVIICAGGEVVAQFDGIH